MILVNFGPRKWHRAKIQPQDKIIMKHTHCGFSADFRPAEPRGSQKRLFLFMRARTAAINKIRGSMGKFNTHFKTSQSQISSTNDIHLYAWLGIFFMLGRLVVGGQV